jgi:hypothetical protein
MGPRGELGMTEPGAVPELSQLTQEARHVVTRRPVSCHLPHIIGLPLLHPGTPPLESVRPAGP